MTNSAAVRRREFLALIDRFRDRLAELHAERADVLPEVWLPYELEQMLAAVNIERAGRGESPARLEFVERADRQAAGDSDYARKFALYCAEIVFDVDRKVYRQPP